jgi:hypothetical protein
MRIGLGRPSNHRTRSVGRATSHRRRTYGLKSYRAFLCKEIIIAIAATPWTMTITVVIR